MVSIGVNQLGRLNLGLEVASLRYFTVCGLQEGYQPIAVNMSRNPALWMSWQQAQFTSVTADDANLQVCRYGPSGAPGSLEALFN